MKRLTNGELDRLSARIDEINRTIDICDEDRDADVLDNLDIELDQIIEQLEISYELAKRAERGPRLRRI